jgi:hypothetical protein
MPGAIVGVKLSQNGEQILVVTLPDHDIPGSLNQYLMSKLTSRGHRVWRKKLKYPLKDFAISQKGDLIVASNYEDQLIGMDAQGREIWTQQGLCRPEILEESHTILCYHDDDAEPQIAFDVFDWSGKKLTSFPIINDVVSFKLAQNRKNIALGLVGGQLLVLGPDFKTLWSSKVGGEIIDLALSNEPTLSTGWPVTPSASPSVLGQPVHRRFQVVALIQAENKTQRIQFFDSQGGVLGQVTPSFQVGQIEAPVEGDVAYGYGSSGEGQWLGAFVVEGAKELWRQGESARSRYSEEMRLAAGRIWIGVERSTPLPLTRESRILAFDPHGQKVIDLLMEKDPTAYLLTHQVSEANRLAVVGTDDAWLNGYRF